MKIKVSTDSTADIPAELQRELDITVLPLTILTEDGKSYRDGVDLTAQACIDLLENSVKLPVSAAVTPSVYLEYFKSALADGCTHLLHVSLGSKGSATFQNAELARAMFYDEQPDAPMDIRLFDSFNYSEAYGMAVVEAARMARRGASVEAISAYIEDWLAHARIVLVPFNLRYARKSGRVPAVTAMLGDALGIKPIVAIEDGVSRILAKVRGEHNVIRRLIEIVKAERKPGTRFVTAYGMPSPRYDAFRSGLVEALGETPEYEYEAGCVIMTHVGPDTVGVVYYKA